MMRWTQAQQETIETRNRNILVSAAAGSGKTTVLIERIRRLILEGTPVDRFLITTFTNAAAAEMKDKLENAIRMEIEQEEEKSAGESGDGRRDVDRLDYLRRQMNLLPQASIGTFHRFAQEIMRDYFYLTDLEPGFVIGDETRMALLRKESVDEIFEERFAEDADRFRPFLDRYSGDRSDEGLKENILQVYGEMRSIPRYMEWARSRTALLAGERPLEDLHIWEYVRKRTVRALAEAAELFSQAAELLNREETGSLWLKARGDREMLRDLKEEAESSEVNPEALSQALEKVKYNSMRASKEENDAFGEVREEVTALRDEGKKKIKKVKDGYFAQSPGEWTRVLQGLAADTDYYVALVRDVEKRYREKKKEGNLIDFDDVMHYAIDILEDEEAAEEVRQSFDYIFIDEYQDSNLLQEEIVRRIAREDNLFMVGDVKQSIYKFRLAEPEIFRDKYRSYRDGGDGHSVKIDLNANFRSRKRIRDAVNRIFLNLMEGYDEDAALHGDENPEDPGAPVQLYIIDRSRDGAEELPGGPQESGGREGTEAETEELEELTEAALVAEIIRQKLGSPVACRDGSVRPLEYGDIAVLSRGKTGIPEIERLLNNEGIPAYGETDGGYYETVEIQVFLNLLRVISNFRQDVPLISVMHSMFFAFAAEDLAKIRIAFREGGFAPAVMKYASEGEDPELRKRIRSMLDQIDLWREIGRTAPLDELMRMLIYDTGYYEYCSCLPAGRQRVSNLRLLMEKGADYEETSYLGLHGFLAYVEAMKRTRLKTGEASVAGEGENVVRVMTVHKSKGLEFPLVILTGAGKSISGSRSGRRTAIHKDFAPALPQVKREQHWERKTLLQQVIADRKTEESLEEEIRILYVALTRPMEQLVIVGSTADREKLPEKQEKTSFLAMVYPVLREMEDSDPASAEVMFPGAKAGASAGEAGGAEAAGDREPVSEEDARTEAGGKEHGGAKSGAESGRAEPGAEISGQKPDPALDEQIRRRLSFVYPFETGRQGKSKYSVSELNRQEEAEESPAPKIPRLSFFGEEEGRLDAARIGTAMHTVMERIDFSRALAEGKTYLEEEIGRMAARGILTREELPHVKVEGILGFFSHPAGRRAASSPGLHKEKEFILQKEVNGEPAIVQGIIDCWFEEEDGLVLIDYKNSWIGGETDESVIAARYREQIALYREALEKAVGKRVKESWLYLFRTRSFIPMEEG